MSEVESILQAMLDGDFQTAVPRARNLPKDSFLEVATLLEQSRDNHQRELCYWILGHLAFSTRGAKIGTYAAQRIGEESTVKLKLEALEAVSFTEGIQDSRVFTALLDHKNGNIRRAAVQALGSCLGEPAERALLQILEEADKPGDMSEAARSLARMCSAAAMPRLQAVYEGLPRIKAHEATLSCITFAMARHPAASFTESVRQVLESIRLWQLGWASLNYLSSAASKGDQHLVVAYLDGVLRRIKRGTEVYIYAITFIRDVYPTEITAGLASLRKIGDDVAVKTIDRLIPHWPDLSFHDHEWLVDHYPDLAKGLEPHPPQ